jgi:hypothetical protein
MSEVGKAIAVIVLAAVAIAAAGVLFEAAFPRGPRIITIHFDGPLKVEIQNH